MARRTVLTSRQRSALFALPQREADLLRHYTLSDEDLQNIGARRRPRNKLGFALQLCVLRHPGRLLAPGEFVPPAVVGFIGRQLDLDGDELADYAVRSETRHEHLGELRRLYGFRSFSGGAARELVERLRDEAEQAQSNEDLVRRFLEACRRTRTILPATTTIERLCADALVDAERRIEARIAERVPPGLRRDLEHLLEETADAGVTRFVWLRQFEPGSNSAAANRLLDRLEHVRRLDVPEGLFHEIPPHRITRLRRQGERYFADGLRELPDNRRLAILVVCAVEWEMFLADAVVETHDRVVGRTYREAARTCEAQLGDETAAVREALRAFAELGRELIGARDTGEALDAVIADGPGWEGLGDLVAKAAALASTAVSDPLNHVLGGYSRFRRYTPRMLRTLDIEASPAAEPLLEAVGVLRSDGTARPTGFLRPNSKWSRLLRTQSDHRLWETAVLFHLRDAFRAGDVWLARSRRYGDIRKALLSAPGPDADRSLPAPTSPHGDWLAERRLALDEGLRRLAGAARAGATAGDSIEDSVLRVERTEGAVPDGAADLVADLYRRMPDARITDILLEVDDATRFTEAFTHLRTGEPCRDRIGLLNVLLAEGVNLGLRKMAEATTTHGFWELMPHRPLACGRRRVRPSVGHRRRGPGRATDGRFLGHGADRLQRRPVLPGWRPRRSPQLGQRPVRGRTRRQGVLARLRPVLAVRHPDHSGHRPRSALHPRRAPDERDRAARPRTVRRHGRLHRPCLRRVRDPRLRVRPAHPGPALETPLRVRTRGASRSACARWSAAR